VQGTSLLPKKFCRICNGRVCSKCRQPQKLSFVDLRSRKVKQYLPDLGPVHVEIDASSFNLMTPDVDRASGRLE
jgi:hypothetical protein